MGKAEDLAGKQFGALTAIEPTEIRKNRQVVWRCQCVCGKEVLVRRNGLNTKTFMSCGCGGREDLTGKMFGRLSVIEPDVDGLKEQGQNSRTNWKCQCECGKLVSARYSDLIDGIAKSCGCDRNDLTGMRFGKLTAIRPTEMRKNRAVVWECKCDCGNTTFVRSNSLSAGGVQSCGCLRQDAATDITGQKFGLLTAIRPTDKRDHRNVVWECRCDCGNTTFARCNSLIFGVVKSCGCLRGSNVLCAGQKIGRLTTIRPTEERKDNYVVWECRCDCGNTVFVSSLKLKSGETRSCGCLRVSDITGQRFGSLIAIRPTNERKNRSIVWECKCDCGNTTFVRINSLTNGIIKSCGCGKRRNKDLAGQKFGLLTAIRATDKRSSGAVVWECKCDCGNAAFVASKDLISGGVKSCGCLRQRKRHSESETQAP